VRLRAITFDFWSTLVDGTPTPESAARRLSQLHAHIVGAGHACTIDELRTAFERMLDQVTEEARESLVDVGPPGRWQILARELGIDDGRVGFEVFERAYEDITLNPLAAAMPHVHVAVEAMKQAGYRLGVICNTGTTGGRTLREVLRRHGLLDCFDVTVFSNEFGISKPHAAIFEHTLTQLGGIAASEALHVGDLEELDVEGARHAGMLAALYAPYEPPGSTEADLVVRDWRDFAGQVAGLTNGPSSEASRPTIGRKGD
jgi:FMN hydrolase / 5-amino-6-(5-phospho-D-ribitylamino)uracil phosphatase